MNWNKLRKLRFLIGPDGPFRIAAGRIRFPDLAFILWSSPPGGRMPAGKILSVTPGLAVEVLSESNTRAEMQARLLDYFAAGVRLVWIADPDERTVTAYTSTTASTAFGPTDTLPGEPVLPGFTLRTAYGFAVLEHIESPKPDNTAR